MKMKLAMAAFSVTSLLSVLSFANTYTCTGNYLNGTEAQAVNIFTNLPGTAVTVTMGGTPLEGCYLDLNGDTSTQARILCPAANIIYPKSSDGGAATVLNLSSLPHMEFNISKSASSVAFTFSEEHEVTGGSDQILKGTCQ